MANGGRIDYTIGFKTDKTGLEQIKAQLSQLSSITSQGLLNINPNLTNLTQAEARLKEIQGTLSQVRAGFENAFDPTTGITNISRLNHSLNTIGIGKIATDFKSLGVDGVKAFNDISKQILTANLNFKQTNSLLQKMGTTFLNTVKWSISSSVINNFTNSIREAYGYVQHLDTSLNDIRIVTGYSAEEMDVFAKKANTAAQALGKATTDYTEASLIYFQQGLSGEDVEARTETTLKAASVTGQSTAAVSEELTAVWNGYQVSAENTEEAVDKLAAVAATTAANLEELSTGMSKVAAAANNMGVDMDQLNATIATVESVTRQAPESVGTALKTIYARMGDLKVGGLDEDDIGLGQVSGTLDKVGIQILDVDGELRDMGEVIEEIGGKWNTWTKAQQTAIAEAVAGKRQYNNLFALFENWDMYTKALDTSRNSMGTLQKQQDIYMESTAAHLQGLKTEFEDVYDSIIDTNDINKIIDGFSFIVDKAGKFIDAIGGGKGALLGLGTVITQVFSKQISTELGNLAIKFSNIRSDAMMLQQEIANIAMNSGHTDEATEAYAAIVRLKKEAQQYYGIMSKEEIQMMDDAITKVSDLYALQDELVAKQQEEESKLQQIVEEENKNIEAQQKSIKNKEEEIQKEEEYIRLLQKAQTMPDGSARDQSGGIKSGGGVISQQNLDFKTGEGVEGAEQALKYANELLKTGGEVETQYEKLIDTFIRLWEAFEEGSDDVASISTELTKVGIVTKETFSAAGMSEFNTEIDKLLSTAGRAMDALEQDGKVSDQRVQSMGRSLDSLDSKFKNAVTNGINVLKEHKRSVETLGKEWENTNNKANNSINKSNNAIKGQEQKIEDLGKKIEDAGAKARQAESNLKNTKFIELDTRTVASQLNDVTRGLTSVAFGIQSIQNLGSIWKNEDSSIGTKILSTITSLGMSLPMMISGFARLREGWSGLSTVLTGLRTGINSLQVSLLSYAQTEAFTADVTELLKGCSQKQLETAAALIGVENIEIATLTRQQAALIVNTGLREGWFKANGQLITSENALAVASGLLKKALETLTTPLGAILAGTLAICAVIKIVNTVLEKNAKKNAEVAKSNAEETQKQVDAYNELSEKVKQLTQDYKSLREEYGKENVEALRSAVYDLCRQYDVQIDLLKISTASYEELDSIIQEVNADIASEKAKASLQNINAKTEELVANSEAIQKENKSTWSTFFNLVKEGSSYFDIIGNTIETITGADFDNWNNFFLRMSSGSESVSKVLNTNPFTNQLEFNEAEFYGGLSQEEQDQVEEYLSKHYETAWYSGIINFFDDSGKNILKSIKDNKEGAAEVEQAKADYQANAIDAIYQSQFASSDVSTATSYQKTKELFAKQLVKDLNFTEEDALKYTEDKLANETEGGYKVASSIALGEELAEAYGKTAEEVANEIADLPDAVKNYLSTHLDLAKGEDSLEAFKEKYQDTIDYFEKNDITVKVDTVLGSEKQGVYDEETIKNLYETTDFETEIGISQEDFLSLDQDKKRQVLLDYYTVANAQERAYNQQVIDDSNEQIAAIEANQEALAKWREDSNITEQDAIAATNGYIENYISNIQEKARTLKNAAGQIANEEDIKQIMSDFANGVIDSEDENIQQLKERAGLTEDEITRLGELVNIQKGYNEVTAEFNSEQDDYTTLTNGMANSVSGLEGTIEDAENASVNWANASAQIAERLEDNEDKIDDLQTAYDSLSSVMDDYNSSGTLTMDNLQTLLEMDTEYLSALEIENGQMTINEETLKEIALARLDEAEAIAYEQAMTELYNLSVEEGKQDLVDTNAAIITTAATVSACTDVVKEGKTAWDEYWDSTVNSEGFDISDESDAIGDALYTKLSAIESVRDQILSGDFDATISTDDSDSDSDDDEADTEDYLEREVDIYREIDNVLEDIESTLGRIQTIDSHTWGASVQKALEEENDLLDAQLEKYEEKRDLQEEDLSGQRYSLESVGVTFTDDGATMTNAEDVLDSLYEEYNSMVDYYNSLSEDDQDDYEDTLENYKDYIDDIEDAMDDYEDTWSDYEDTLDDILDTHYELIENEVNQFNNMVDVHLDLNEAETEWNDFWYDVVQDVDSTDFSDTIAKNIANLDTLVGGTSTDIESSTVGILTGHLTETIDEVWEQIANADNGGGDSLFGDDTKLSEETLTNYRDQLITAVTSAKTSLDNISETYLDMLDDAKDMLDDQVEDWETIGDHIEHNIELIKLVSGDEAYDALDMQYQAQYENNVELTKTQKQSADFWSDQIERYKTLLSTTEKGSVQWDTYSDALDKATENYQEAVGNLDKALEETLKGLDNLRENKVNAVLSEIDKTMSGGLGLDLVEQEWKLIDEHSSKYLDNVERAYSMEDYANILEEAANATGLTAENQAKINQFMDEELDKLNKKEKLTQYDIEESKARLEILKQQIALEDAQANKSKMRLRRDSQGNYTYQYIGDEDKIDEAEKGGLTARKAWYDLVKKQYKDTTDWILELEKNQSSLLAQIDEAEKNGETQRLELLKQMYEQNLKDIEDAYAEAEKNKQDLYNGTAQYFKEVEDANILPQSKATVRELVNEWVDNDDSFIKSVKNGISQLESIQKDYADKTKTELEAAGVDYSNLKNNGIDPTTTSLQNLTTSNNELATSLSTTNTELTNTETKLKDAETAYDKLKTTASDAIKEANAALKVLAETAVSYAGQVEAAVSSIENSYSKAYTIDSSTSSSSSSSSSDSSTTSTETSKKSATIEKTGYGAYVLKDSSGKVIEAYNGGAEDNATKTTITGISGGDYTYATTTAEGNMTKYDMAVEEFKRKYGDEYDLSSFATGGYTGDWTQGLSNSENGRLAILHQKELVLNAEDTQNILQAVYALRDLAATTGSLGGVADSIINAGNIQAQMLGQVGSGMLQALANMVNNDNSTNQSYKNMTVNADFSGVRSADAIYQALMELENYGMQESYSIAPHMNTAY